MKEKLIKKLSSLSMKKDGYFYVTISNRIVVLTQKNVYREILMLPNLDNIDDRVKPEVANRMLHAFKELFSYEIYDQALIGAIWLEVYQEECNIVLPDYESPFVN